MYLHAAAKYINKEFQMTFITSEEIGSSCLLHFTLTCNFQNLKAESS